MAIQNLSCQFDRAAGYCFSFTLDNVDRVLAIWNGIERERSYPKMALSASKAVTGIVPGVVGIAFYGISRILKREDCYHLTGNGTQTDELIVETHNANRIVGAPLFDKMLPRVERPFETYQLPTVLCIQEVFGYQAHLLADQLADHYCDIFFRPGGKLFGMDAGIAVASNVPVVSVEFHPFEEMARNSLQFGFMLVETEDVIFVNTHFDIGSDELHRTQMNQIKVAISGKSKDVYVCGDLNSTNAELFGFKTEVDPTATNEEGRIDYLHPLVCDRTQKGEEVIEDSTHSDHKRVRASINLI